MEPRGMQPQQVVQSSWGGYNRSICCAPRHIYGISTSFPSLGLAIRWPMVACHPVVPLLIKLSACCSFYPWGVRVMWFHVPEQQDDCIPLSAIHTRKPDAAETNLTLSAILDVANPECSDYRFPSPRMRSRVVCSAASSRSSFLGGYNRSMICCVPRRTRELVLHIHHSRVLAWLFLSPPPEPKNPNHRQSSRSHAREPAPFSFILIPIQSTEHTIHARVVTILFLFIATGAT